MVGDDDLRETAGGFDAAFDGLFRAAFRVSYRVLGSVADAEDAAAEAVARALVRWRRVGDLPYRDAWVMRVASNVAIDALRKRRPLPVTEDLAPDIETAVSERTDLAVALAALPKRQREVMALRHIADLSKADVARCLGISLNSVKKHSMWARASLRTALAPQPEEVDVVVS